MRATRLCMTWSCIVPSLRRSPYCLHAIRSATSVQTKSETEESYYRHGKSSRAASAWPTRSRVCEARRFSGCCVRACSKHITPHRVTGKEIIETLKFSYGTEAALRVNAPGLMVKKKRGWVSEGPVLLLCGIPAALWLPRCLGLGMTWTSRWVVPHSHTTVVSRSTSTHDYYQWVNDWRLSVFLMSGGGVRIRPQRGSGSEAGPAAAGG